MIEQTKRVRYQGRPRKDPDQYVTDLTEKQREAQRQAQARYRARVREKDLPAFLEKQRAASLKYYHKKRALAGTPVVRRSSNDAPHDTAATGHDA